VFNPLIQFAAEGTGHTEPTGGIAALGLDAKAFVFQLLTFILVLLFLRKYVYGKLVDTLEARRTEVLGSLEAAKQATDDLEKAEAKIEKLLAEARQESADIVATAHKEAVALVEEAESKAQKKAEHIVHEAKAELDGEVLKARTVLQKEAKALVAEATEKIIGQKLTGPADEKLIEQALAEVK
jgi:F-type H+-transporting ATPase subunit b